MRHWSAPPLVTWMPLVVKVALPLAPDTGAAQFTMVVGAKWLPSRRQRMLRGPEPDRAGMGAAGPGPCKEVPM
jgi:hypothetical protein